MTEHNDIIGLVLTRITRPQTTILDGEVKTTPAGEYVVIYTDTPRLSGRLSADYAKQLLRWRAMCVGRNAGEARHVASWVVSRLVGWRPVPEDRTVGVVAPIPDGAPVLPDRSVPGDVRFSQTLVFTLTTTRSTA